MPTPTSLDANSFFTTPANDILNQAPNQKLREQTKLPEIRQHNVNLTQASKYRQAIKHQYVSSSESQQ